MREHEIEPVPGLPERLPQGEQILWQGAPRWTSIAVRVFHARAIAIYFALLLAWIVHSAMAGGEPLGGALLSAARTLPFVLTGLGLLLLFAWLIERTTLYTITSSRVVLRFGIALPITMNVPFTLIESAGQRLYADGTGDFPLRVGGPDRQSLVVLWPHVRPWRAARPEPMLRCVPNGREVAAILKSALAESARRRGIQFAATAPEPQHQGDLAPSAEPAAA